MDATRVGTWPTLGFGGAALGGELPWRDSVRLVEAAWAAGFRHFDTAPPYGGGQSEHVLGEVLGPLRAQATLVTKVGIAHPRGGGTFGLLRRAALPLKALAPDLWSRAAGRARHAASPGGRFDPASVRDSVSESLRRLRTDRVDALLLHEAGPEDLSEGLGALLDALRRDDVIGAIGVGSDEPFRAHAVARQWPARIEWVQHAMDWAASPPDSAVQSRTVVHGALRSGMALLSDPRAASFCREPEFAALASLLQERTRWPAALVAAARVGAGPGAGVVVSTRRIDHLHALGPAAVDGAMATAGPLRALLRRLAAADGGR
jgi:aryl-alcohol dehydrogenase-like predicted oxidoreductase